MVFETRECLRTYADAEPHKAYQRETDPNIQGQVSPIHPNPDAFIPANFENKQTS